MVETGMHSDAGTEATLWENIHCKRDSTAQAFSLPWTHGGVMPRIAELHREPMEPGSDPEFPLTC